jgi:DSF synthase
MNAHVPTEGTASLVAPPSDFVLSDAPAAARAALSVLREIEVDYEDGIAWSWMRHTGRPAITAPLIADGHAWAEHLAVLAASGDVRFGVLGSRFPGIYNLGGDLNLFAEHIRNRDLDALIRYGEACVGLAKRLRSASAAGLVSVALVQGTAMGGGFEGARFMDLVVAERCAKFSLPEALFNLFPGMGAVSHLVRRMGPRRAREMLLDGEEFDAASLHDAGVVDILTENGAGRDAIRAYARKYRRRHNALASICGAVRDAGPSDAELVTIVRFWAEAALKITESDLRMMEKLVQRQERLLRVEAAA